MSTSQELAIAEQKSLNGYDAKMSERYRVEDEDEFSTPILQRMCRMLGEISGEAVAFALYFHNFHCLQNVRKLVGVDLSPPMIAQAHNPAFSDQISADEIELICASMFDVELPAQGFDFVFAIGVFGDHVIFSPTLCDKIYAALRPNGRMFVTVVSKETLHAFPRSLRRRTAELVNPLLLGALTPHLTRDTEYYCDPDELRALMADSPFVDVQIERQLSAPPNPKRVYYEVQARRA